MDEERLKVLIELIKIQCTKEEISRVLNTSRRSLERELQAAGYSYKQLYEQHQADGNASLRRSQWAAARHGNAAMLIWLGKQYLGQRDMQHVDNTSSDGSMSPHKRKLTGADLDKELARRGIPKELLEETWSKSN